MKQHIHSDTPKAYHPYSITLLCDGVSLPANIGGILRLADAFGVKEVIFANTVANPDSRKVSQVSRSTHHWVNYRVEPSATEELQKLTEAGFHPIVLELTDKSQPLQTLRINPDQKLALIIGSEISGVSEDLLRLCRKAYHIPVFGRNSSMNVTHALAIALYQITLG